MNKRPNIVIINPDQMRCDSMRHAGNPAAVTPNLDALAEEGTSFLHAFCQNPVCVPSRCSFMSGWYPHVAGHRTMQFLMRETDPVLLKYLKDSGYHVWMNQRNDLLPAQHPENYSKYCSTYFKLPQKPEPLPDEDWRGKPDGDNYYSFYRGIIPPVRDTDSLWVKGAADFIRNWNGTEPFCLFLPLLNPHPPYKVERRYYDKIDKRKLPARIRAPRDFNGKSRMNRELNRLYHMGSWTEDRYDELRAVYLGMCSKVDDYTGIILNALKEKGLYDNTAVFFFSDHGDYTGDYDLVEKVQNSFEDCLSNVPFIVKLPAGMQTSHGLSDELVELIDFYATVEDISGIGVHHRHFGKSLVPYLAGQKHTVRDRVFCEGGFTKGESYCSETGGAMGIVEENIYYPRLSLQVSAENYNGKAIMCRTRNFKYVKRLYEQDELYDLERDPNEIHNCIQQPEYRDQALQMKAMLLDHYMETCDAVPFEKDQRMDSGILHG